MSTQADPKALIERWQRAMNRRDVEMAVSCFAPDYQDESPAHPHRAFRGQQRVRENFSALFNSVSDLQTEVLRCVADGDIVWMEWRLHGTRSDGTRLDMAGVNLFGIRDDRIVWGRVYTEPVEEAGGGIEEMIGRMTQG